MNSPNLPSPQLRRRRWCTTTQTRGKNFTRCPPIRPRVRTRVRLLRQARVSSVNYRGMYTGRLTSPRTPPHPYGVFFTRRSRQTPTRLSPRPPSHAADAAYAGRNGRSTLCTCRSVCAGQRSRGGSGVRDRSLGASCRPRSLFPVLRACRGGEDST